MDDLRYTLGLDGSKFDGAVNKSVSGLQGLGGALAALGATGAFVSLIKRGFEFNKTMGDSEAAIAQVLAQFKGLDAQAAKGEAAAAMQQIIDLEPKAAGSLKDLTGGFLATLAASQSAGLSVKQNIDLVGRFANAMANAAIPTDQLAQEMRSIITANIGADSSLARILGITNEMVNQAREAGVLYDFLASKIGKLGEAGDTAAVAFSSLESAIDKASGALAKGLFQQALDGSKNLTQALQENEQAFVKMGESLDWLLTKTVDLGKGTMDWARAVGITAGVYYQMWTNGLTYAEAMEAAQKALTEETNRTGEAAKKAQASTTTPAAPAGIGDASSKAKGGKAGRSAADMQAAREALLLEVAAAEAAARGQDRKAAALLRELAIRRDMKRIIEETGASEAQARKAAETLNPEARRADGRRRIRNTGVKIGMGSEGGGGLDQFHRLQQKREVTTEEMAANRAARGGGRGLPIGQGDGFVPAFPAFPETGRRASSALSPPPKTGDASTTATADPSLKLLASIDRSLKGLKAA